MPSGLAHLPLPFWFPALQYALRGFGLSAYESLRQHNVKVICMCLWRRDQKGRGGHAGIMLGTAEQHSSNMGICHFGPLLPGWLQVVDIAPGNVQGTGMAEKSDMHGELAWASSEVLVL